MVSRWQQIDSPLLDKIIKVPPASSLDIHSSSLKKQLCLDSDPLLPLQSQDSIKFYTNKTFNSDIHQSCDDSSEIDEFFPEEVKNVVNKQAIGRTTNISNFVSPKPNLELSIFIGQNTKMGTPTDGIFDSIIDYDQDVD